MSGNAKRVSARNRSIGALHAGRRALGWDDETYRGYLEQVTGKRSAADCSDEEVARVLDGMRQLGFQRKDGSTTPTETRGTTQLDKARALWGELAIIGELKNPSEAGFCAYIERVTHRSRPEWCTPEQLSKAIEGLKAWLKRAIAARHANAQRPIE